MDLQGHVQNGVVVLEGDVSLPEGVTVRVVYSAKPVIRVSPIRKRVEFPLVRSSAPGSAALTNDRIAEILMEEDIETLKRSEDVSS